MQIQRWSWFGVPIIWVEKTYGKYAVVTWTNVMIMRYLATSGYIATLEENTANDNKPKSLIEV
jgi:hypothetical protein